MCVPSQASIGGLLPHQWSRSFLKSILKADIQQKIQDIKLLGLMKEPAIIFVVWYLLVILLQKKLNEHLVLCTASMKSQPISSPAAVKDVLKNMDFFSAPSVNGNLHSPAEHRVSWYSTSTGPNLVYNVPFLIGVLPSTYV